MQRLGITSTASTPPGSVAVFDDQYIYDGKAVRAFYGKAVLQNGGGPVWYEFRFSAPVQSILFERAALLAGPSGVTHPPWKASAYNAAGQIVATTQEDEIRSMTGV